MSCSVVLETDVGSMTFSIVNRHREITHNFLGLASIDFYNGSCFGKVVEDVLISAGDPTTTGEHGYPLSHYDPSFSLPPFKHSPTDPSHLEGSLAMLTTKGGAVDSRFYITFSAAPNLDTSCPVIGHLQRGESSESESSSQSTLKRLKDVPTDLEGWPLAKVIIRSITVHNNPYSAPLSLKPISIPGPLPSPLTHRPVWARRRGDGEVREGLLRLLGSDTTGVKAHAGVLFVRGMHPCTTESGLLAVFRQYGEVLRVTIPHDKGSGRRGFGFVEFRSACDAESAQAALDGAVVDTRVLEVDYAHSGR